MQDRGRLNGETGEMEPFQWIEYDGTGQPVSDETLVAIWCRGETFDTYEHCVRPAADWNWSDKGGILYYAVAS